MPGTRMYTMAITTAATAGANKKGIFFDIASSQELEERGRRKGYLCEKDYLNEIK